MDEETAEALTRTKALYDAGVLTEEEYNAKKQELLHAPAVVVAQPPANEHGGVVQGHVYDPRGSAGRSAGAAGGAVTKPRARSTSGAPVRALSKTPYSDTNHGTPAWSTACTYLLGLPSLPIHNRRV